MRQVIVAFLSAAVALLPGCSAREAVPAVAAAPPVVTVVQPRRGDVVRAITVPGDLVALNQSALYAKVTGYLKSIAVDKGDWVRKGQPLAEIEVPELEEKLKRARAELQVRRVTYDRLKGVWATDRRLVAREDVDVAQGAYEQAAAHVEELEAMVGYTHLVAPFDGVVTARYVDPGALIEANGHGTPGQPGAGKGGPEPVVTVADIDTLRVYVYVPEEETSLVQRGLPAKVRLREFPGREFRGTVTRFATALDLSTRTMLTEVDLDNARHELYPGMYADLTLELVRHTNALQVPTTAVGSGPDGSFVYVVKDGRLAKVAVATGLGDGADVEVTSGLAGDEQVVGTIGPGLEDGARVQTVTAPPTSVARTG